jgi:hypothetical protein
VQVLDGINATDWGRIRSIIVEVHTSELQARVQGRLASHFHNVSVQQEHRLRGSQLCMIYAAQPVHGSDEFAELSYAKCSRAAAFEVQADKCKAVVCDASALPYIS